MPRQACRRHRCGKKGTGKKLIEFCVQASERISCEKCRKLELVYGGLPECGTEDNPDFKKCPYQKVKLHPQNVTAWELWLRVCNQHIMSEGGPVALNLGTTARVMDMMGIDDIAMLDLMQLVHGKVIKAAMEKAKK